MGIMNVKEGVDLTHPKVSSGWILGAIVGAVVLFFALGVGGWLYRKAKSATSGVTGKMTGSLDAQAGQAVDNSGWL